MKKQHVFFSTAICLASVCLFSCQKSASVKSRQSNTPDVETVLTPYGRVPASQVFAHEADVIVSKENGHLVERDARSGLVKRDLGAVAMPDIMPPTVNTGSFAGTTVPATDTIQSFSTTWKVPPVSTSDTTIFYWNGMDGGALQPVLQWENGSYTVANWYYLNGYHHGPFVAVTPGQSLTGVVTLNSYSSGAYSYTESFTGISSANVTVVMPTLATQPCEDIEAYCTVYTSYPPQNDIRMKDINCVTTKGTHPPAFTWAFSDTWIENPSGKCGVSVNNSSSNGEIDFYMR